MDYQKIVNYLVTLLNDPQQLKGFIENPADYFNAAGITDGQEQEQIYALVVPLNQLR